MKKIFIFLFALFGLVFLFLPTSQERVFIFNLPPPQIIKTFPKVPLPKTELVPESSLSKKPSIENIEEKEERKKHSLFKISFVLELDPKKIIEFTNEARTKNNLPPLKENQLLNQSAYLKAKEMLELQYFAHESPSGKKLENWLSEVGYSYLIAGENLAMGNFPSEKILVDAWLQSPGHRENILNPRFDEIGVAVLKGNFQGKETLLAVAHYAKPQSACPKVDEELKELIEKNQKELENLAGILNNLKKEIVEEGKIEKVDEYNNLVGKYNNLLEDTKNLVEKYNEEVKAFNECLNETVL